MANTFGFGGTIEASGIASAGSAQVAEEYGKVDLLSTLKHLVFVFRDKI